MALPELIANSPVPGTVTALTKVKTELKTGVKELLVEAAAPPALHAEGQFRIIIDHEILLIEGPSAATTTWKILERAAEGSSEAAHAVGASVYHMLTAAALKSALVVNSPALNASPVFMRFGSYEPKNFGLEHGPNLEASLELGSVVVSETGGSLLASCIENTGEGNTVAVYGSARGKHAWGGNLIGQTTGSEQNVTGLEVDFGHLSKDGETEPETGAIAYGLTIQYFPHAFPAVNPAPYIQIGVKRHEPKEGEHTPGNLGCLYGIRFLGEHAGTNLISTEGTVIDFHNVTPESGSCKYGINLSSPNSSTGVEINTYSEAALRFGDGHNVMFGKNVGTKLGKSGEEKIGFWGSTPVTKPKVTGSRSSGAALKTLLEQLANAGLITNESST